MRAHLLQRLLSPPCHWLRSLLVACTCALECLARLLWQLWGSHTLPLLTSACQLSTICCSGGTAHHTALQHWQPANGLNSLRYTGSTMLLHRSTAPGSCLASQSCCGQSNHAWHPSWCSMLQGCMLIALACNMYACVRWWCVRPGVHPVLCFIMHAGPTWPPPGGHRCTVACLQSIAKDVCTRTPVCTAPSNDPLKGYVALVCGF